MSVIRSLVCCRSSRIPSRFLSSIHSYTGTPYRFLKMAAKSCDSISTQMGKLFYIFDFPIVLHNEILETFSIGTDRIEETGELWLGIITSEKEYEFLALQINKRTTGDTFRQVFTKAGYKVVKAGIHH